MTRRRAGTLLAVGAAVIALGGCGLASESGGARETLPPLPPPGGVLVNKPPLPEPQVVVTDPPTATPAPANDDANPTSVAGRFLGAVRDNVDGTANALVLDGRDPSVFGWARRAFEDYTSVQGPDSWGAPVCAPTEGTALATCTWLAGDAETVLVMQSDGETWRVSHPRLGTATADTPVHTADACIAGDDNVNFRGGPGRSWPLFAKIPPGTCQVVVYDREDVVDGDDWRFVEIDGQQGWVIERVLRGLS